MKKLCAYIILCSMTLHCGARLGLLDHLYQKRNDIALALGLIQEVPIATCSSDYDFNGGLKVVSHNNSHSVPSSLTQAREINLFFTFEYYSPRVQHVLLSKRPLIDLVDLYGLTLVTSIFHPPTA